MATNKSLVNYAIQNIAFAANIADPTPSSKIKNITETVINELDNFEDYGTRILSNMYLDSCDSSFLDRVGSQEGIQRIRAQTVKLTSDSMFLSVRNNTRSRLLRTFPAGYTVQISDDVWVSFTEGLDLSDIGPNESKYVTAEIKVDVAGTTLDLPEGSLYSIGYDSDYSLVVESNIYVPIVEESEADYRARLLYARQAARHGSESAIRLAVASSSFVTKYAIDYSTSPAKVYLYSDVLAYNPDYQTTLETYSVNTVRNEINLRKSAGTTFEVLVPTPVNFKIVLEPRVTNPRNVDPAFFSLDEFMQLTFNFGQELIIDSTFIETFKKTLDVDLGFLDDYNIKIIQTYLNFDYASENNSITIHKYEYPFLESISVG